MVGKGEKHLRLIMHLGFWVEAFLTPKLETPTQALHPSIPRIQPEVIG